MKAFVVIVLLFILFLVFAASASSNLNLTNTTNPSALSAQNKPTIWPPVASANNPSQQNQNANPAAGVPVTGGIQPTPAAGVIPLYTPLVIYYQTYAGIPITGGCTNPYVVQPGDSLSSIGARCGANVSTLLGLNPFIYDPDLIFPGQVLWLYQPANVVNGIPVTGPVAAPTPLPAPVNPIVIQPSTSPILPGTSLHIRVKKFPPNATINIGVGKLGMGYQVVNQGITDANGVLETVVTLPPAYNPQDQWTVVAVTTSGTLVEAASQPFTISH